MPNTPRANVSSYAPASGLDPTGFGRISPAKSKLGISIVYPAITVSTAPPKPIAGEVGFKVPSKFKPRDETSKEFFLCTVALPEMDDGVLFTTEFTK